MEYQLQKMTEDFTRIPITTSCLQKIKTYAQYSKKREIYGFLLNSLEKNDGVIRRTLLAKHQEVSSASVNLEAMAAAESKEEIESLGMKVIGFWHSHAGFGVFHSGIDDTNLNKLFRGITQNNEEQLNEEQKNYRYFDIQGKKIVYRIGNLELAIKPKNPEFPCETRILNPQYVKMPKENVLGFMDGPNLGIYLRDGSVVLQLENIGELSLTKIEPPASTLGLAYSLVVNENNEEYGEIAAVNWCKNCQISNVQIYKECKTKIIDDTKNPTEKFSNEELEEEIKERTKRRKSFF